jgi:L-asparaginase/Glu-tRNA(Gln) amidotransferase subunit D|tara:strand:+ start:84 stop:569 length:486 start_codon:yes stop_codon:yes gene_type:complete
MLKDHRYTRSDGDPILFTDFCNNVESYAPKSGSNTSAFRRGYVDNDDVEGIVFVGLGAGNINEKYNEDIKRAVQAGKPVLIVTNCLEGAADSGIYGVGSAPLLAGAQPAGDMTAESINQKLMYALGRVKAKGVPTNKIPESVDRIIRRPYAGEITFSDRTV